MPTHQEFLDIVLSRTQRRLPTQIRAGFKISRIRGMLFFSSLFILMGNSWGGYFAVVKGIWMVCGKKKFALTLSTNSILYTKGQIYPGNLLREVPGYIGWVPTVAGYSSVP